MTPIRPHFWQAWCGAMVLGGGDRAWQQAGQAEEARFLLRPSNCARMRVQGQGSVASRARAKARIQLLPAL